MLIAVLPSCNANMQLGLGEFLDFRTSDALPIAEKDFSSHAEGFRLQEFFLQSGSIGSQPEFGVLYPC